MARRSRGTVLLPSAGSSGGHRTAAVEGPPPREHRRTAAPAASPTGRAALEHALASEPLTPLSVVRIIDLLRQQAHRADEGEGCTLIVSTEASAALDSAGPDLHLDLGDVRLAVVPGLRWWLVMLVPAISPTATGTVGFYGDLRDGFTGVTPLRVTPIRGSAGKRSPDESVHNA